jgi:hypothetical protein
MLVLFQMISRIPFAGTPQSRIRPPEIVLDFVLRGLGFGRVARLNQCVAVMIRLTDQVDPLRQKTSLLDPNRRLYKNPVAGTSNR